MKPYGRLLSSIAASVLLVGIVLLSASPAPAGLPERLEPIKEKIVQVRGLGFKEPLKAKTVTQVDIITLILEELNKQYTPEEFQAYQHSLEKLGLLPPGTDLMAILLELYGEQVAGLYNPRSKELWLDDEFRGLFGEVILAHEMTHALQDQHFDIMSLPLELKGEDDLLLATHALLEGDATVAMADYMLADTGLGIGDLAANFGEMMEAMLPFSEGALGEAPEFVRAVLVFPYARGTDFIQSVKGIGGWEMVNALYKLHPLSTEQILHPKDKFFLNDPPVAVSLPDISTLLGEGWEALPDNVLGEFQLRVLMEGFLPDRDRAASVAAGWGGDRYRCYRRSQAIVLSWVTVWDTDSDAAEFLDAYKTVLREKYFGENASVSDGPDAYSVTNAGLASSVSRREKQVIVAESLPPELLPKVTDLLWESGLTELPRLDTSRLPQAHPKPDLPKPPTYSSGPKGEVKGNRFISRELGFEISLPGQDWEFLDELPTPFMLVGMVHKRRYAAVNVMVLPFPPVVSVEQVAAMVKAGMKSQQGGYQVLEEGNAEVSGQKGYQVTAAVTMGVPQKVRQVLVHHEGKMYIITCSGKSEDFDALAQDIAAAEHSMVLYTEETVPEAKEAGQ